jgi:hypothetical protein
LRAFQQAFKSATRLWQGIRQTKSIDDIRRTVPARAPVLCSEVKHKSFTVLCALRHIQAGPVLALAFSPPGTVLAKCVVQHSPMSKKPERQSK